MLSRDICFFYLLFVLLIEENPEVDLGFFRKGGVFSKSHVLWPFLIVFVSVCFLLNLVLIGDKGAFIEI